MKQIEKNPKPSIVWSGSGSDKGWARRVFDSRFLFSIAPFPLNCSADKTGYGISILAVSPSGRKTSLKKKKKELFEIAAAGGWLDNDKSNRRRASTCQLRVKKTFSKRSKTPPDTINDRPLHCPASTTTATAIMTTITTPWANTDDQRGNSSPQLALEAPAVTRSCLEALVVCHSSPLDIRSPSADKSEKIKIKIR